MGTFIDSRLLVAVVVQQLDVRLDPERVAEELTFDVLKFAEHLSLSATQSPGSEYGNTKSDIVNSNHEPIDLFVIGCATRSKTPSLIWF